MEALNHKIVLLAQVSDSPQKIVGGEGLEDATLLSNYCVKIVKFAYLIER